MIIIIISISTTTTTTNQGGLFDVSLLMSFTVLCSDVNTMTSKLVTQPRFRAVGKRTQTDPEMEQEKI